MTIQQLIEALQGIGNKDVPVCVQDGMDTTVAHQLVLEAVSYWDGNTFQRGLVLQIQGR